MKSYEVCTLLFGEINTHHLEHTSEILWANITLGFSIPSVKDVKHFISGRVFPSEQLLNVVKFLCLERVVVEQNGLGLLDIIFVTFFAILEIGFEGSVLSDVRVYLLLREFLESSVPWVDDNWVAILGSN